MNTRPLTSTMVRELRCIEQGRIGDLDDYGANALAFHAREKVLTALLSRELIVPDAGDYALTDAGRAAIDGGKA
jgi:hypothetical protein